MPFIKSTFSILLLCKGSENYDYTAKLPMFFMRFRTSKLWLIQASLSGEYNP